MSAPLGYVNVAWRPVGAFGLLPVAAALAVTMGFTAVLDLAQGRAGGSGESTHLLDVAALVLLWLLAGRPGVRGRLTRPVSRPAATG